MRLVPVTSRRLDVVLPASTCFSTTKCWPATAATCGKWVMEMTWCCWPRTAILSPTALAISPPTLASISSNTMSGVASWSASELLTASMTREISPLEAIWRRGLSGSPGLGPNWKSTVSRPFVVGFVVGMRLRSKAACLKPSSLRCVAMSLASFGALF